MAAHFNFRATSGSVTQYMKFQQRLYGTSSWSDVGAAVSLSATTTETGFMTLNRSLTNASGDMQYWEIRVVQKASGTNFTNFGSTGKCSVSIG